MSSSPPASQTLKSIALLEKGQQPDTQNVNGDILVWSFPSLDSSLESVLKSRSGLNDPNTASTSQPSSTLSHTVQAAIADAPFRFSRYGAVWIYLFTAPLDSAIAKSKKVLGCSIAIITSAYNPSKYQDLSKIFLKAYTESDLSPIPMMQSYLSILTTNKYSGPFGTFDDASYDARRAMIAPLKFLIQSFGTDSILIWIAMILKKRVIVYHPRISEVQNLVKIFPLLGAWHRQDLSLLRPFVNLSNELELTDLTRTGVYVAGVTDESCQTRKDLYDLYIDVPTKTFTFGGTATSVVGTNEKPNDFNLTKFHRTTAETFLAAAEKETDQGVIKIVAQQTKEFLYKDTYTQ